MITMLLLLVIYITFIGMGLPSSLFGAAFPAIQTDFALSPASANYVTILVTGFTVISSILIGPPAFGWLANFIGAAILPAYIIVSNVLFVIV